MENKMFLIHFFVFQRLQLGSQILEIIFSFFSEPVWNLGYCSGKINHKCMVQDSGRKKKRHRENLHDILQVIKNCFKSEEEEEEEVWNRRYRSGIVVIVRSRSGIFFVLGLESSLLFLLLVINRRY